MLGPAREIILRDSKGRPMPGPIPLRNDLRRNGIPFLGSVHRARVSSANKLYAFVAKLVKYSSGLEDRILVKKNGLAPRFEHPQIEYSRGKKPPKKIHR